MRTTASLMRPYRDSSLYIVMSIAPPKEGSMMEKLTTRLDVHVPADMGDLTEGDVCRSDGFEIVKCGSLS